MPTTAAQLNVVFNSQGADAVRGDLESVGTEIDSIGKQFAVIGGAGVASFGLMTNSSMQFTSAMANVNSIARLTNDELDVMSSAVLDMAGQFGAVPDDLANALYDITSSGVPAAEALNVLEAATVAAGAGLTDTATSARAITAALNAYGLSADEAGNVSDVLFKIVDSGVITFEQLANNMGNTLPIAASLGVGIEELGAAYAQLTLSGISASQAETQIAALMRSTLNETEALTQAVQEYGYASSEALIQTEGLSGFLTFLMEASGGTVAGLQELVGSAEAVNAALVLTQDGASGFTSMLGEMEGAAQEGGYTLEVFGIQMDNAAGSVRTAQAELSAAAITMGSAFEPLVDGAARAVAGVAGAFNGLSGPAQSAIATFSAVASGAALVGGSLVMAIPKIVAFRNAMASLRASGSVLATLAGSMGPLTLGVGAAAAAFVYFKAQADESKAAIAELDDAIQTLGDAMQNLRLDHLDEQADMVQAFGTQVLGVQQTARAFLENDAAMMAEVNRIAQEEGRETFDVFMELEEAYTLSSEGASRFAAAQGEISAAFMDSRIDHAALSAELDSLARQFESFDITYDEYVEGIIAVSQNLSDYRTSASLAADATRTGEIAISAASQAYAEYEGYVGGAAEATENFTDKALGSVDALASIAEAQQEWIAFNEEATASILELTRNADYLSQVNLAGLGTGATEMAESLDDAAGAMDSVLGIFSTIDAMGSRYGQAVSIAEAVIGAPGVWGEIDNMLQRGTISLELYNEAVLAGHDIQNRSAGVEENLNVIRVKQMQLLGEVSATYDEYIAQIAAMTDAEEQMVTLGWMDTGMQDRVQQFADLTNQLATLGPAGEAAMQQVVDGIVATDPVLTGMLENLGLIEQQANGDYTINMDAAGAMSEIAQLTEAIVALIDYMDNGLLDKSFTLEIKTEVEEPVVPPPAGGGGYTGAYWTPPWKVKPDVEAPEWPVWDIPQPEPIVPTVADPTWPDFTIPQPEPVTVPVDADTGAAAISIGAFEAEASAPVTKTVTVSIVSAASAVGQVVAGAAQDAASAISGAGASMFGIPESITVTVNLVDNATAGLTTISDAAASLGGQSVNVTITADNSDAVADINAVIGGYNDLSGAVANITITGDNSDAMAAMLNVNTALFAIDGMSATIYIYGNNSSAMGAISEVQAYNGSVLATSYMDIVTRRSEVSLTAHALGGYVSSDFQLVGERGPELVSLPYGSYVHTAGETSRMLASPGASGSGGTAVNVTFAGDFYGSNREDLDDWAETSLVPSLVEALHEERRGQVSA